MRLSARRRTHWRAAVLWPRYLPLRQRSGLRQRLCMSQPKHRLHSVEVRVSVRLTNFMSGGVIRVLYPRGMQRVGEKPRLGAIPSFHTVRQMLDSLFELNDRVIHPRRLGLGKSLLLRLCSLLCKFCCALCFRDPLLDCRLRSLFDRGLGLHLFGGLRCFSDRLRQLSRLLRWRCRHRLVSVTLLETIFFAQACQRMPPYRTRPCVRKRLYASVYSSFDRPLISAASRHVGVASFGSNFTPVAPSLYISK